MMMMMMMMIEDDDDYAKRKGRFFCVRTYMRAYACVCLHAYAHGCACLFIGVPDVVEGVMMAAYYSIMVTCSRTQSSTLLEFARSF